MLSLLFIINLNISKGSPVDFLVVFIVGRMFSTYATISLKINANKLNEM